MIIGNYEIKKDIKKRDLPTIVCNGQSQLANEVVSTNANTNKKSQILQLFLFWGFPFSGDKSCSGGGQVHFWLPCNLSLSLVGVKSLSIRARSTTTYFHVHTYMFCSSHSGAFYLDLKYSECGYIKGGIHFMHLKCWTKDRANHF